MLVWWSLFSFSCRQDKMQIVILQANCKKHKLKLKTLSYSFHSDFYEWLTPFVLISLHKSIKSLMTVFNPFMEHSSCERAVSIESLMYYNECVKSDLQLHCGQSCYWKSINNLWLIRFDNRTVLWWNRKFNQCIQTELHLIEVMFYSILSALITFTGWLDLVWLSENESGLRTASVGSKKKRKKKKRKWWSLGFSHLPKSVAQCGGRKEKLIAVWPTIDIFHCWKFYHIYLFVISVL